MRKRWLAVALVLVVGVAGYLGAQAYSSHVFERELARAVAEANADGRFRVERDVGERGWFHSQGRIALSPAGEGGDWRLVLPFDARHGLLHTRLGGALQIRLASDAGEPRALFGDVLASAEPRWTATLDHFERHGEAHVTLADFELATPGGRLAFTGAELDLSGRLGDLRLTGQVAPLRLTQGDRQLIAGPLFIDSRYRFDAHGDYYHQRNELILDSLEYRDPRRAPLTLDTLRYIDETRLEQDLQVAMSLSLQQARAAGQPLLAGNLELVLERLDGEAVRELIGELQALLEKHGDAIASLDVAERRALLARLEPAILATLAESPRLTLETLNLSSAMFGVDMRGHGELTFDGTDSQALEIADLAQAATRDPWRERLDGRLNAYDVPPLLLMQLGLPLDTRQLTLSVTDGELRLNGRELPELPL
ncbi:DUF945 family protein [Halomonas sp. HP20-15]|uniref:DUF945 family protein n=1 Tax=Halomonas sp. HP20-15 TaxID=3085901 RepID=UPI0029810465|nr:DUF945 family protein [Halomonas sp. HP20-15]MDW5377368.1 DUF945 family protein [Halomonas sp. HP20-15]